MRRPQTLAVVYNLKHFLLKAGNVSAMFALVLKSRRFVYRALHGLVTHLLVIMNHEGPWLWWKDLDALERAQKWLALRIYIPKAVCVLYVEGERVLAVARRGTTDQWGLPGGKVDPGEEPLITATRETFEEALTRPRGLTELYCGTDGLDCAVLTYVAKEITSQPRQGDAGPVAFVSWDQLVDGPFGRYNAQVHKQWLARQR